MCRSTLFGIVFLMLLVPQLYAQSISIGIKGGVNIASASTDTSSGISSRQGLILGGVVELELFPPLALQVGFQYAEKGAKVKLLMPGLPSQAEATYKFNYLEFPINFRLGFGSPTFQVYGVAGTTLGTLMKAVGEVPTPTGTESSDLENVLEKTDLALELGGGILIGISRNLIFTADARRSMGLKNIDQSGNAILAANAWKPRDLRVTAGLNFRFSLASSPSSEDVQ